MKPFNKRQIGSRQQTNHWLKLKLILRGYVSSVILTML